MPARHKLAVFDIDGTIAVKGVIPKSVIEGLKHIQSKGYLTTVSTGRAYRRMRDALGEDFETVISPEALISLEHGTKMVHRDGTVVQADYFGKGEVEHIVDFVRANIAMVKYFWYALPDPEAPYEFWVSPDEDIEPIREKRGRYGNVFTCSYDELKERMLRHQISHVAAKLQDFITTENLKLRFTRSNIDVLFLDGLMQIVGNLSDKSKAIEYLEKFHEVEVKDMIIAGNAINDVDMLNLKAGKRILVGNDEFTPIVLGHLKNVDEVIRVDSPEKLGEYLQEM